MPVPPTFAGLRAMSDEEVVEAYDAVAQHVSVGLDFLRAEILRREQARQARVMVGLTWIIAAMTAVVTAATLLNVWLVSQSL